MSNVEQSYDYVIVGAGVAAASAVKGIRSQDGAGRIAVLGSEPDKPVYRPVLTKDLWLKDDETLEGSSLAGDLDEDDAVDLVTDTTVTGIDPGAHVVRLADGSTVGYGKLLLATGAEPRVLAVDPGPRVIYYRTAADYQRLRAVATEGSHVAVIGGGYIGSEITSALVQNGVQVTLVLDLEDVQEQMFPRALAATLTKAFEDRGVTVVHGSVEGGQEDDGGVRIRLGDGTSITADAAVIGVGVLPRTGLAEAAGLEVDNGVVVDEHLRTSDADVYAAGDVASYPDALLGRRRVEHVDHAEKSGEHAGKVMAGADDDVRLHALLLVRHPRLRLRGRRRDQQPARHGRGLEGRRGRHRRRLLPEVGAGPRRAAVERVGQRRQGARAHQGDRRDPRARPGVAAGAHPVRVTLPDRWSRGAVRVASRRCLPPAPTLPHRSSSAPVRATGAG